MSQDISTHVIDFVEWVSSCLEPLTHWGRDKIDAISQTTFSSAFSSMKMFEFRLIFHWSLFVRVQSTIFQHWSRYWLGAVQATSHYLNQRWLVYRRICAWLGLNVNWHPVSATFQTTQPRTRASERAIIVSKFFSYIRKDFNYPCHASVKGWYEL